MRDDETSAPLAAPSQEDTNVKTAATKKAAAPATNKKAAAPAPAPRRSRKEAAENLKKAKADARAAKAAPKAAKAAPPKAAPKAAIVEAINKHQRKNGARADGLTPGTGAAILVDTLLRKGGATNAELCEAVGWAACLPAARKAAERGGYHFEAIKKPGELTRYHARKR